MAFKKIALVGQQMTNEESNGKATAAIEEAFKIVKNIEFGQEQRVQSIIGNTAFHFQDQSFWDETVTANTDPRNISIIRFAERWLKLMQHEIDENGQTVAEAAPQTLRLANDEKLSRGQIEIAVTLISLAWEHGEQLWEWKFPDKGATDCTMPSRAAINKDNASANVKKRPEP